MISKNSFCKSLSVPRIDVPKVVIGRTHPPPYPIEYGYKAEFENLIRNNGFARSNANDVNSAENTRNRNNSGRNSGRDLRQGNLKRSWHALQLLREEKQKEKLKNEYVKGLVTGKMPIPSAIDRAVQMEEGVHHVELTQEEKEEALAEYKASLPPFHLDSLVFALRDDKRPNFNVENVANLIEYNEVHCEYEQPKWRRELICKNGPAGKVLLYRIYRITRFSAKIT